MKLLEFIEYWCFVRRQNIGEFIEFIEYWCFVMKGCYYKKIINIGNIGQVMIILRWKGKWVEGSNREKVQG